MASNYFVLDRPVPTAAMALALTSANESPEAMIFEPSRLQATNLPWHSSGGVGRDWVLAVSTNWSSSSRRKRATALF